MKYIYSLIAILSFGFMIAANYLSTSGVIPWLDTRGLQNTFPFDYMPPGITFAISWGVIYTLVSIYVISLIYRIFANLTSETKKEIWYFSGINLLNLSWIIATAFKQYSTAGVVIFIIFVLLVLFLRKFGKHLINQIAFGIYLGWITVAAFCLTLAQFVYSYNNSWALSPIFGNSLLIFGVIIAGITFWKVKNPYALFWSLAAILIAGLKLYGVIG